MVVNLEFTIKGQPRISRQGEFSLWGKEKHFNVQSRTQTKSPISKKQNVREWMDYNSRAMETPQLVKGLLCKH